MRRYLSAFALAAGVFLSSCSDETTPGQAPSSLTDSVSHSSVATANPGSPLPGLDAQQLALFNQGLAVFSTVFTPATGLGPLFNSTSCASCHDNPTIGGYGDSIEVINTAAHRRSCDALGENGGPVQQQHVTPELEAALGITAEPTLPGSTASGLRSASFTFGLGLLDAVPDRTLKFLARIPHAEGVHGRPAILSDGRVGKFGRKANTASLDEFSAGAFFNEMGVTNAFNPIEGSIAGQPIPAGVDGAADPELDPASLQAGLAFMKFLAPVAPLPATAETKRGQKLFSQVRCTSCHIPTLLTGWSPVPALRFKAVSAYSDLLLHDLGPENADACNGVARASEFRTQPLMGSRFLDMFMHDAVPETVDEAVARHGGEASASRHWFFRLNPTDRQAIVSFVMSL